MSFTQRKDAFTHFKAQELQKHLTNKNIRLDQAQSLEKAYNPSTGNFYTDLHALALDAKMLECGYSKNQWVSLSRAKLLGADPKELAYIKANTRNKQNPQGSVEKVSISYLQTKDTRGNVLAEPIFNTTDLYNVEVFQTLDTSLFKEPNPQSLHRQEHSAQVRLVDLQNILSSEHYLQLQEYMQARFSAIEQENTEHISETSDLQTQVDILKAEVQRLQAEHKEDLKRHAQELEVLKTQNTAILEQLNQLVAQFASLTQQERIATIQAPQEPITAEQPDRMDNSTLENTIQKNTTAKNITTENTIQENTIKDNTETHNTIQDNIEQDNTATATEDTTPTPPKKPLEHSTTTIKKSQEQETHKDFWTWQELFEEIAAESRYSYNKEKMATLYGEYFSKYFAFDNSNDFFKGNKERQKEVLTNRLKEFYFNNPYYLPVYTIPEKLEAICVSLEQGKSYLEDAHLRGQLLEVYKRHYYEVDRVGKEAISPITHPELYTPMQRVGSILAQIFEENREEVFIPNSVARGALPLDELNEHLIKGLRIASMLYERDAYGDYSPFTPQPFAFDIDLQAAIMADSKPLEVLAQELSLEDLAQWTYSHVIQD
ncbi:hypothetical protein [Helicobacter suis]|uniref:hypothetical protein n=1 Tax=Helicobacter suis TaxID=104628 RepID=UPI0013D492AD|nr:hypothetical protein [Helicobacter suis]